MLSVALLTLGDPRIMSGGYLFHRRIAALAPRDDARIDFFSLPARPFPLSGISAGRVLRAVVRRQPDVLLLDSIAAAFAAPWLHRWRPHGAGIPPLVGMLHQPPGGIDHGPVRKALQARLDLAAYRCAAKLLVASQSLAADLRARGAPGRLLTVVPPGRDVATAVVRPAADLRRGRRCAVLSVGNWVARKGLLDLLEAVGSLPRETVTLHLVGETEVEPSYAEKVRRRLAAPDLTGRVLVHGSRPIEEVAGFYEASDIFALPSLREPYGTVYGEAMAAGLPVVGWSAGNLPYLARDGLDGLIVPPGDVRALTGALDTLASDEKLRARMAASARARAETFPSWDESARLLFAELRAVVRAG